jgi:hypothetical protein
VSTSAVVLLGIIAVATLVIACVQVGLAIFAGILARKVDRLTVRFEQDIRPLIANASEVANHAARASELAVAQMERADRVFSSLARRVDETAAVIQATLLAPAREGRALLAAAGAVFGALREMRQNRGQRPVEDEDPLFIG